MIKKELYVICKFDEWGEFANIFMIVENEDEAKTICEKKNKRDGFHRLFCFEELFMKKSCTLY